MTDLKTLFKEFKPSLLFLVKFFGIYVVLNILYGFYIESYDNQPDPVTDWVTIQSSAILNILGQDTDTFEDPSKPNVHINNEMRSVLSVYEGCNGLNTMIVFLAFIVAFNGRIRKYWWFIPMGFLVIHLANLARIILLYYVSEYMPKLMYFTHKYFFTASIYVVIFILWYVWVTRFALTSKTQRAEESENTLRS